jgi:MFS family permease
MTEVASGLLNNRNWRRLFVGQAVSMVGFFVLNVTLVLWVGAVIAAGTSWAPAAVSALLICAAAPVFLFGPIAGVYVDRWDRRRIMVVTDVIRAFLTGSLLLVAAGSASLSVAVQLIWVYLVVIANSVCAQFFTPARVGVTVAIVAEADRSRALSLMQATGSTAAIIGPPLGAPLLFTFGVQWALIANVAGLLFSAVAIAAIRMPAQVSPPAPQQERNFRREFVGGLQFFFRNPVLVGLTVSASIATLGAGALNTLHVFFVEDNLRVDASWLGTLVAGYGAGSVLGALVAAWLATRLGEGRLFWSGLLLAGVLIMIYSQFTSLPPAIVMMVLLGMPLGAINAVVGPLVVRVTPQELLGRIMAAINPLLQGAALAAIAVTGVLASTVLQGVDVRAGIVTLGPYDSVFLICGVLMVIAAAWAVKMLRIPRQHAEPVAPPTGPLSKSEA